MVVVMTVMVWRGGGSGSVESESGDCCGSGGGVGGIEKPSSGVIKLSITSPSSLVRPA